jgi:hypothetical protein
MRPVARRIGVYSRNIVHVPVPGTDTLPKIKYPCFIEFYFLNGEILLIKCVKITKTNLIVLLSVILIFKHVLVN